MIAVKTLVADHCAHKKEDHTNQGMDSVSDTQNTKRAFGLRTVLSLSIGLGALSLATPALAQDAGDETEAADEGRRLGAVTVTATRREGATVQDVPIAVTALDAGLLDEAGVQRINDLEQIAPSLQITQGQSAAVGSSLNIRGIGTGGDNPGFEPAVGVFIDGVYRTKTGIALGDLPELAGVEVLRGPQGTLFGRNVSAGALSVTTAGPEREGRRTVSLQGGDFGMFSAEFTGTGATSENTAARIDVKYRGRDGYIDDVNSDRSFNNIERKLVRGQFEWEGEDADLRLIADWAETNEECCSAVNLIAGDAANPTVPSGAGAAIEAVAGINAMLGNPIVGIAEPGNPEAYKVAASPARGLGEDVSEWGVSAEFNKQFKIGRFTSITAYRDWGVTRDQDIDFSGIDRAYRDDYTVDDATFTQEFRLQGVNGNIDWLVGAFALREDLELVDTIRFGADAALYADALTAGALEGATGVPGGFQLTGSLGPSVPSLFVNVPAGVIPGVQGPVNRFGFDPTNPMNSLAIAAGFDSFFAPAPSEGDGQQADQWDVQTTALALFTHNEISFGENTTLTVGLRYNYEEKELEYDLLANSPTSAFYFTPEGQSVAEQINLLGAGALLGLYLNPTINPEFNGTGSDSQDYGEFTGTLSLAHNFTPDLLVYGGYSRGFKSGGWNLDRGSFDSVILGGDGADAGDLSFDEEIVDAFELGWKLSFLDGKGTFNGAVYFQDVDGYQFNTFLGSSFVTYNTAAEARGIELDAGFTPVADLVLQGGFAWTDTTYASNPDELGFELEGERITNIPEYTVTGAATYTPTFNEYLEGLFHVNFRWTDEHETINSAFNPTSGLGLGGPTSTPSLFLVNARIGVAGDDGKWEFAVFGENLTDEYYNVLTFPVPEQTGVYAGYPVRPQMFGAELRFSF